MIAIEALDGIDGAVVERLLDRAFGPDRHRRTAYRIRAQAIPIAAISLAAIEDGALIGSIQCWPVALFGDDGAVTPMVMVGPVAVDPLRQGEGIGRRLMVHALDLAAAGGLDGAMMLIGDPEYYGRFFGFTAERTTAWRVPGPVERHRLLARGPSVPIGAGLVGQRLPVTA